MNIRATFTHLACLALAGVLASSTVSAKSAGPRTADAERWPHIVELVDPPLAAYDGRAIETPERASGMYRQAPTDARITGERKLDTRTPAARDYLEFLAERQRHFLRAAEAAIGRDLAPDLEFRIALNGISVSLTAEEAAALEGLDMVLAVRRQEILRRNTDAGPRWVGAEPIWTGALGLAATRGEGVVVGVIDSGINWDHPAFGDLGGDGHDHVNPRGQTYGLCDDAEVLCNDKLIGVYDFVQDRSATEFVEENTKGYDNDFHGTHMASVAVGNVQNVTFNGVSRTMSGVAPHANLITYRVCYIGDEDDPDDDGCWPDFSIAAVEQAIADQVDVINFSVGGEAFNPWAAGSTARAFLNARNAGIVVVTSAGNAGPAPGSISSPANAPWMVAVGAATHTRVQDAAVLENLAGGDTPAPGELVGIGDNPGIGIRPIVHAADFGYPLCGVGDAELGAACGDNTGASNPWDGQTPFNGEIVVCDRGVYGRIEKGKNVQLAGAGGMILANTGLNANYAEDIGQVGSLAPADQHCLPATHIGRRDGDLLRAWLATGAGHEGSITVSPLIDSEGRADILGEFSSRGPLTIPGDILKPNVIAPGVDILGASQPGASALTRVNGTSPAAPHVAGAAALLRAIHPGWSVDAIVSALETTATSEIAIDEVDGLPTDPFEHGRGRIRVDVAAEAGLSLEVPPGAFLNANPFSGGDPATLNLAGLVEPACEGSCSFRRTVTDLVGGASWTVGTDGFPDDVEVTVTPSSFTLANGASRALDIVINVDGAGQIGNWIYGDIVLSSSAAPDARLTTAVFASGGDLPLQWSLSPSADAGWQVFSLAGLTSLPDATFSSGNLVKPQRRTESLPQDPTDGDPYDSTAGTFTVLVDVPEGALWLHTETIASTANDIDLFVGRDVDGDGFGEVGEELCSSTTPDQFELCDLLNPEPGRYWIVVQNWESSGVNDSTTLEYAVVAPSPTPNFAVSGPGITAADESFDLRLSWWDINALPGEDWLGAVGVGTTRETPGNVGVIPIRFTRASIGAPQPLALFDDRVAKFALGAGQEHDLAYLDLPGGTTRLTATVSGDSAAANDDLVVELHRVPFDEALANPPLASPVPTSSAPVVTVAGSGGNAPQAVLNGPQAGRWYVLVRNEGGASIPVEVAIDAEFAGGATAPFQRGLWDPVRTLFQGVEYNQIGAFRGLLWYTYNEDGTPAFYNAAAPQPEGDLWTADLLRITNDGDQQQAAAVGTVSMALLSETDAVFSYTLYGQSGSERMRPTPSAVPCPNLIDESQYVGVWARAEAGVGGASVGVNANSQAQVHYLFDGSGNPVWLLAFPDPQSSTAPSFPFYQFEGFCAVCEGGEADLDFAPVGTLTRQFDSATTGSWTLDYTFAAPVEGSFQRSNDIVKISDTLSCP